MSTLGLCLLFWHNLMTPIELMQGSMLSPRNIVLPGRYTGEGNVLKFTRLLGGSKI